MSEQIFRSKGNYCLYLKSVSKQSKLQHYEHYSGIAGDVVFIKEESIPRMKWRKWEINELICGNDGKVRRVYQTKLKKTVVINRPLQLIVSFKIASEPPEPAETIALSKPRRDAAKTADTIRRLITS